MSFDLQAAIDAAAAPGGAGYVDVPDGDTPAAAPVRLKCPVHGSKSGRSRLLPQFGSGPALYALPLMPDPDNPGQMIERPFGLTLGPPLVPGPGNSIRLVTHRCPDLSSEPGCDLSGASACTLPIFYQRVSGAADGVIFNSGCDYGVDPPFQGFGLWDMAALDPGFLWVYWAGRHYRAPFPVANGTTYYLELTYDGSRVALWAGLPGQQLAAPVWSTAFSGKVPQRGNGLERVTLGYDAYAPNTADGSHGANDAWVYGFSVRDVCDHPGPFAAPSALPAVDPHTRLQVTGETDGVFLVSRRGDGRSAYCLPPSVEAQGGGVVVTDVQVADAFGSSALLLRDTILARVERVSWVEAWVGLEMRGSTYRSTVRDISGKGNNYSALVVGQCMGTVASGWMLASGGVALYASGAVGGTVQQLNLTPYGGSYASVYQGGGGAFRASGLTVDDEGAGGQTRACLIADRGSRVVADGGQFLRASPGPVLAVARGGSAVLTGCELFNVAGSAQQVEAVGPPPGRKVQFYGCDVQPPSVPYCLTPGAFQLCVAGVS